LKSTLLAHSLTCAQNAENFDKLIQVLDDPNKKVNQEKVLKSFAKSLRHTNRLNLELISIIVSLMDGSFRTDQQNRNISAAWESYNKAMKN
jgi:hypothetical protein